MDASQGAYVRYKVDELLGIVAIESQRAEAFIVGEDLGTVEPGTREKLAEYGLLSYKLLWFEEDPPANYPKEALAAITTHDLPTVAGLWTGADLEAQKQLELNPNEQGTLETKKRLKRMAGLNGEAELDEVVAAAHQLLSQSPCRVVTAAIDDALAITERPNMPATTNEWPNWSIALPESLEDIQKHPLARRIATMLAGRGR